MITDTLLSPLSYLVSRSSISALHPIPRTFEDVSSNLKIISASPQIGYRMPSLMTLQMLLGLWFRVLNMKSIASMNWCWSSRRRNRVICCVGASHPNYSIHYHLSHLFLHSLNLIYQNSRMNRCFSMKMLENLPCLSLQSLLSNQCHIKWVGYMIRF